MSLVNVLLNLSLFIVCINASPRKYNYVSTAQFQDELNRLSDIDMHPHLVTAEPKFRSKALSSNDAELTKDYWINNAKKYVETRATETLNTKKAKNVIIFLGDGMGHASVAAARLLLGGEEAKLAFENFPYTASSKTYCLNAQVPDSACTVTAFLHGVKTNNGIIGFNGDAIRSNCDDQKDANKHTNSIAKWFQEQNRSSGIVTTTRITHATPAGAYANIVNRDWEANSNVLSSGCDDTIIDDIAEQLIKGDVGSKLKVIFGGGSKYFINSTDFMHRSNGLRTDGKNLINQWLEAKSNRQFVQNREQMMAADSKVDELMGLFDSDNLQYQLETNEKNEQSLYPTLTEMTVKAIDILNKDENGYFLLVEGGRIDHGHHESAARLALGETVEFSNAIQAALVKVDLDETLIVATADHSHVMTLAGYAPRGSDIFGISGIADDSIPYFTLSYANGPGYALHRNGTNRVDPRSLDTSPLSFKFPSTVPLSSETHAGEDVGVWATGANAHLFSGVIEQNVIAHIMAYASCVGKGLKVCDN